MAFCSNCGAELENNVRFCGSCGSSVTPATQPVGQVQSPYMAGNNTFLFQQAQARQESLNELSKMISYFGQKADSYEEYDNCHKRLAVLMRGTSSAPLVWGIILISMDLVNLLGAIFESGHYRVFYIVFFLFFFIPSAGLIVTFIVKKVTHARNLSAERAKVTDIAYELTRHYTDYGLCLIGVEYTNPKILVRIADVIRSGRAVSPKEAVNTMLIDSRRSLMLLQSHLASQAARQDIRGNTAAAVFAAASFFIR